MEEKKIIWATTQRKVNDLKEFECNPRDITRKGYDTLKESLKKFNLVEIPVVNFDGTIIAGHQRIRILIDEGRGGEMIDVRIPDRQLSLEELWEYNLRSNIHNGHFDPDKLSLAPFEIEDFKEIGFSDGILGFGEGFEAKIDRQNAETSEEAEESDLLFTIKISIDPSIDDHLAFEEKANALAREFPSSKIQKITR